MRYEISEVAGKDGYPKALKVWSNVFPSPSEHLKRYQWYYGSESFKSNLYLLRDLDTKLVVGTIGSASRPYNFKNDEQVFGLCSDFAVEAQHQTLAPAMKLLKGIIEGSRDKCSVLIGFPNSNAVQIMRRVGFHVLGDLPRYALILKSKSYIKETSLAPLSSILSGPIDILLKLYFRLSRSMYFSGYELTEIFSVDDSFDNFWLNYCKDNQLYTGKRDRAYLCWLLSNPNTNYRAFALKNKKTGELSGYAIVRINDDDYWYIFDFLTLEKNKELKCLIQKLIAAAINENATSVSIEFLGSHKVSQLLKNMRFSKRIADRRVILQPLRELNEKQSDLYDINNWHLTSADELG